MKPVWACALLCLQLGLTVGQTQTPINPPAGRICGLEGFNLNVLQQATYWTLTVPRVGQCLIPPGITAQDIQSCTIDFAVCHTLPADSLCANVSSSMCQEILLTNGSQYDYSIGTYDSRHTYTVAGNGFAAERTGVEVNETTCNGNLSTIFTFTCNTAALWNASQPDVSNRVTSVIRNPADPCQYIIEVVYSGACYTSPTISPNHCQLDDYDLGTLASQAYWYADVDDSLCLNATSSCRFYFSFCHAIPPEVNGVCYENGVCQVGDQNSDTTYGMGLVQNYTRFYPNVDAVEGGFHVDYENGSAPSFLHNCTAHGLRTRIVFSCDSSVAWTQPDQTGNIHVAWDRTHDVCMYVFSFQYNGACISTFPTGSTASSVSPVGWILIALFLGAVLIYLVVGSAFQYFVKKERGVHILPNYDFWREFVMHVLEGCRFFLDAVTCFMFEGKIKSKVEYDKI